MRYLHRYFPSMLFLTQIACVSLRPLGEFADAAGEDERVVEAGMTSSDTNSVGEDTGTLDGGVPTDVGFIGQDSGTLTDTSKPNDANFVGEDAGGADGGPSSPPTCATYCTHLTTNCSGANAQYENMADCIAYCRDAGWRVGAVVDTPGNTLGCRVYYASTPASENPVEHCASAGPGGDGICGITDFRTESSGYVRVDRMGMPGLSTALVSVTMKNSYNDGNPSDAPGGDAHVTGGLPRWVPEFGASLVGIHAVLNDDLLRLGLTRCGTVSPTMVADVFPCLSQTAGGPTGLAVLTLLAPDALHIDTTAASGFPNGRHPSDPVMDMTLAGILLDMRSHSLRALVEYDRGHLPPGLNPTRNDVAGGVFLTTFPYLHPSHTP